MNTVLSNATELFDFIDNCMARRPTHVGIATFALNLGFEPADRQLRLRPCRASRFLSCLGKSKIPATILVGLPSHDPCWREERIRQLVQDYPDIRWKFNTACHAKLWIFWYPRRIVAITGGHNLGVSTWLDVSVGLTGTTAHDLAHVYRRFWDAPSSYSV